MLLLTILKIVVVILILFVPVFYGLGLSKNPQPPTDKYQCTDGKTCMLVKDCAQGQPCFVGKPLCEESGCGSSTGPTPVENQSSGTMQVINSTSESPLHVFAQTPGSEWVKVGGNGQVYPAVNWYSKAWNPVAAHRMSEIILQKGEWIVLTIPEDLGTMIMMPVLFKGSRIDPLTIADVPNINNLVYTNQYPTLIEGGTDKVLDVSCVDGANLRVSLDFTTKDKAGKVAIERIRINKNPCDGIDGANQQGCINPTKTCGPTADCCEGTQKCKFNTCSEKFFDIKDDLRQFIGKFDCPGTNPDQCCSSLTCPAICNNQCSSDSCNDSKKGQQRVKTFINNPDNIKVGSQLGKFCNNVRFGPEITKAYCYDYNDTSSSIYLRDPYKFRAEYFDLVTPS